MRRDTREVIVAWTIGLLSLAAVAALLVGCAAESPEEPTAVILEVDGNSHHVSQAVTLWAEVADCMSGFGHTRQPERVRVQTAAGVFLCGSTWAAGCTWWGFTVKVVADEPTYTNALAHEFVHVLEAKNSGALDYAHTARYWRVCDWRNN